MLHVFSVLFFPSQDPEGWSTQPCSNVMQKGHPLTHSHFLALKLK